MSVRRRTAVLAAAVLALLPVVAAPASSAVAATAASYTVLPSTSFTDSALPAATATATRKLFTSASSYQTYFGHAAPSAVDWSQQWVYLYSAGDQPSGGYAASVPQVRRSTDHSMQFLTALQTPGAGCATSSQVTRPYALVAFAKDSVTPPSTGYQHSTAAGPACTTAQPVTSTTSFSGGAQGWIGDFADYSPATQDLRLDARVTALPAGTENATAFRFQSFNRNDDVFAFLKRRLTTADGVVAGQRYSARTSVTFWTDSSADCIGSGSPGGSVYLKAGASTVEPVKVLDQANNIYRLNVDKGNQGTDGVSANVIGNIDDGRPCSDQNWVKVTRTSSTPVSVQADASGQLWLLVGTDSAYEGYTELYYSSITATLTPIS